MNKIEWVKHLSSWKQFLTGCLMDSEDIGEKIKIERQLRILERVRCGAALNPMLLSKFINPSLSEGKEAVCDNYFFALNNSQKRAVRMALGDNDLTLIQGPPGTGKTQVIAETCLQLYRRNPGIRILVCSETHVAVNTLIGRIAEQNDQIRIVRIRDKENDSAVNVYSPEVVIRDYLMWANNCIQNKEAVDVISNELADPNDRSLEKALALSSNIAGMTCNRVAAYDFKDSTEMFDVAIVDEVCKATLPEILAPLLIARKAILLGDPKQLPPVFCSTERRIIRQIEGCNLDRYMYVDSLFLQDGVSCLLDTQYRMVDEIGDMISECFYGGKLKNGRNTKSFDALEWIDYMPSRPWPIVREEESDNPRIYNEDECKIIAGLINDLIENDSSLTVGVISPYRAQVEMLRERVPQSDNIKIDTVDGFQGKERDVIIFSITRTNGSYRFLADVRRVNVALSRARDKIIIVGDIKYADDNQLLSYVRHHCKIEKR